MEKETKDRIWSILERYAGAYPRDKDQFIRHWPECMEFRFCGSLGFGGKVWYNGEKAYIDCYSEDLNPDRQNVIDLVNELLK